ncbi:hypothetical protein, partial [Streptomyces rubiginosohelvolus]
RKDSLNVLLYSEILNFWVHNFMLQFISIFLFLVKFGYQGIPFVFLWIIIVSYLYKKYLIKHQKIRIKIKTAFNYLNGQILNISFTILIFTILIIQPKKMEFKYFLSGANIRKYFQHYFQQIGQNTIST